MGDRRKGRRRPPAARRTAEVVQPRRGLSRTGIVVVLSITGVVLVIALAIAVVWGAVQVGRSVAPVEAAVEAFVTDLESGDHAAAYERLCAGTKATFTVEAFRAGVERQPKIMSHEIVNVSVHNYNGDLSATVTADLTLDSGFVNQHTFALEKEDGRWVVCGNPY